MGRPDPKSKKGSPAFIPEVYTLSIESRNKLIELLGYDPERDKDNNEVNLAMIDVEFWLGFYLGGGVEALDNAPRPADYREMFNNLQQQSTKLLNDLTDMNGFYSEKFTSEKSSVDLNDIKNALKSIIDVSASVINKYKYESKNESKGRPKKSALKIVIGELSGIFRDKYYGQHYGQKEKKAFKEKSPEETSEIEFVETALLDAEIIKEKNSYKTVERHFLSI